MQEWQLVVPNGNIQLDFKSFDIAHKSTKCERDWVEVSDGSYSQKICGHINGSVSYYYGFYGWSTWGHHLGSSIPGPFLSSGPTMTVRMHTDNAGTRTGFRAVWGDASTFLWVGDNSVVDSSNWAPGHPVSG